MASIRTSRDSSPASISSIQKESFWDLLFPSLRSSAKTVKGRNHWLIKDIRKWVSEVAPYEVLINCSKMDSVYAAYCMRDQGTGTNHIFVSKKFFSPEHTRSWQKAILLHEMGHLFCCRANGAANEELKSHIWAMTKASAENMTMVYNELNNQLLGWKDLDWNKEKGVYRRYIIASNKFCKIWNRIKKGNKK